MFEPLMNYFCEKGNILQCLKIVKFMFHASNNRITLSSSTSSDELIPVPASAQDETSIMIEERVKNIDEVTTSVESMEIATFSETKPKATMMQVFYNKPKQSDTSSASSSSSSLSVGDIKPALIVPHKIMSFVESLQPIDSLKIGHNDEYINVSGNNFTNYNEVNKKEMKFDCFELLSQCMINCEAIINENKDRFNPNLRVSIMTDVPVENSSLWFTVLKSILVYQTEMEIDSKLKWQLIKWLMKTIDKECEIDINDRLYFGLLIRLCENDIKMAMKLYHKMIGLSNKKFNHENKNEYDKRKRFLSPTERELNNLLWVAMNFCNKKLIRFREKVKNGQGQYGTKQIQEQEIEIEKEKLLFVRWILAEFSKHQLTPNFYTQNILNEADVDITI